MDEPVPDRRTSVNKVNDLLADLHDREALAAIVAGAQERTRQRLHALRAAMDPKFFEDEWASRSRRARAHQLRASKSS